MSIFLALVGAIPYAAMGILMGVMGYSWSTWQLWVMLGIMFISDTISYIKGSLTN